MTSALRWSLALRTHLAQRGLQRTLMPGFGNKQFTSISTSPVKYKPLCLNQKYKTEVFDSKRFMSNLTDRDMSGSFDNQDGHFTNKNGKKIFCKYWSAGMKDPKALVFISHGATEHHLPYGELAEHLREQNLFVFGHDHQGHGQSEGARMHIDDFRHYSRDVMQHVEMVHKHWPDLPCFVLGHSMGGAISILTVLDNPKYFKGMVLIGPVVTPENDTVGPIRKRIVIAVGRMMARIYPNCPVLPLTSGHISRDPAVVDRNENDPLTYHGWLKAKWGMAILDATSEMEKKCCEISTPFLVLHGEDDRIINSKGSEHLYKMAQSKDKTIKIVPEGFHQLHQEIEPVKTETMNDVKDWILKRVL